MRFSTWLKTSRAKPSPMTEWYSDWLVLKVLLIKFTCTLFTHFYGLFPIYEHVSDDRKGLFNT